MLVEGATADSLGQLGVNTSVGMLMTKFGSNVYVENRHLKG